MWQISNKLNSPVLERYADLIIGFFKLVIDLSQLEGITNQLEENNFLEDHFERSEVLDNRLLLLNKSARNQIKPLVKEIVKLDTNILKQEFEIFQMQNRELSKFNYNLSPQEHPEPLRRIFKDYFYDKFFGVKWIWVDLVGKEFNREIFKTNFKDENKLYVCSYCDTDTISSTRNAWLEHFLPKSKFPYLACNVRNLIPSCTSCNVSGSGKGEDANTPISTQYNLQIGDTFEFILNGREITIEPHANESIENFISLLKLRERYNEKGVFDSILSTLKSNYNSIVKLKSKDDFDKNEFFDFIHDIGRNRGYYFVQKSLFKFIDEI